MAIQPGMTVAERLRLRLPGLATAERKVARVLTSSVASPSPFDALTPAMALVEALIAALVDQLGDAPRARMARYDELTGESVASELEAPP